MVLDWFDTKEVVLFANEIVRELEKPRGGVSSSTKAASARMGEKEKKKLDALIVRVLTFAKRSPLNIYKKAKLLNAVKWQLRDLGEDEEYIEEIIRLLTATLNA